jgi:hypothetical protein
MQHAEVEDQQQRDEREEPEPEPDHQRVSQPCGKGPWIANRTDMQVNLDTEQTQVLREMLENTLTQLRVESARADSHEFREMLHRRERVIDEVLNQLEPVEPVSDSLS